MSNQKKLNFTQFFLQTVSFSPAAQACWFDIFEESADEKKTDVVQDQNQNIEKVVRAAYLSVSLYVRMSVSDHFWTNPRFAPICAKSARFTCTLAESP